MTSVYLCNSVGVFLLFSTNFCTMEEDFDLQFNITLEENLMQNGEFPYAGNTITVFQSVFFKLHDLDSGAELKSARPYNKTAFTLLHRNIYPYLPATSTACEHF